MGEFGRIGIEILRCPCCRGGLLQSSDVQLKCECTDCGQIFPVVNGVPILINEKNSVFSFDDFVQRRDTFFVRGSWMRNASRKVSSVIPEANLNVAASKNLLAFAKQLEKNGGQARVLVIGGSILGQGMASIATNPEIELIESDVSFGPRTMLICDAHDQPFRDGYFDGVIIQAVLEHVVDPVRCVEEIYRVLKMGGIVYSDTPFMQQVHGRQYDFTRFTRLGHRRLFRHFSEIDSGISCGPGMALAWAYRYFLLSFAKSKPARFMLFVMGNLTSFWLKYFDYILAGKPASLDAAAGFYFFGRKTSEILADKELLKLYKGGM
jgi:uncharacterized protein YbaR (Trm112 family)/SAM-dependent methyltransferase